MKSANEIKQQLTELDSSNRVYGVSVSIVRTTTVYEVVQNYGGTLYMSCDVRQRDDMRWEVYGEYCYAVCDDLDDALEFVASCRAFSDSQVFASIVGSPIFRKECDYHNRRRAIWDAESMSALIKRSDLIPVSEGLLSWLVSWAQYGRNMGLDF